MASSVLTPLQLIAGAGLLQNQGISVSPELQASITAYRSTPLIAAFLQALALDGSLATLGASSVPAFSNSVPAAYSSLGTQMTAVILAQAAADFASGDISKFIQALNQCLGYSEITNLFINSAVNSQTYLANTFSNTNDSITGDITTVNLATQAFGSDLANLGQLIDLTDVSDLGSPLALVQRIVEIVGNVPILSVAFLSVGIPQEVVLNLNSITATVADSVQKLMYLAMTKINTDNGLTQILRVLGVTTANINTMADLLNPVKLFPNSYQSLTVTTSNGPRAIYIDSQGRVNSKLSTELPPYVVSAVGFTNAARVV
jgi:hypothetical protein